METLRKNGVTYLTLLAAVEKKQKELTYLKTNLAENFSSPESVEDQSENVRGENSEIYYEEENETNGAPVLM